MVAQQIANGLDAHPAVEQAHRKAVPQAVRRLLGQRQPTAVRVAGEGCADRLRAESGQGGRNGQKQRRVV